MTHNELLAKIDDEAKFLEIYFGEGTKIKSISALRALVKLHKPIEEDGKLWCEHEVCYNHIEFLERDDCDCSYPCPTIQVIEKELQ